MAELSFAIYIDNDGSGNYASFAIDTPAVKPSGGIRLTTQPYIDNQTQTEAAKTITNATNATPIAITSTAHGYANGDLVYITGVVGNTRANGGPFVVGASAANTFTLLDTVGNAPWTSGGTVQRIARTKNIYNAIDAAMIAIQNYKAAGN
jgi:hypothetical protein